jgi:RNA polymerase sigma-70 factor (ECF subfamily)
VSDIEAPFLAKLKGGDEAAFAGLVADLGPGLLDFARTFTSSTALAEDIVQETWLAVIRGLHAFEARASLKTWIFSILVRRARTIAARDARLHARAAARAAEVEWEPGQGRRGLWDDTPLPWSVDDPEAIHQSQEALLVLQTALDQLPEMQRQVVLLRDVEGLSAADVCNILALSETNVRVILHRGRAKLRQALDRYMRDGATSGGAAPSEITGRVAARGIR